MDRLTRMREGLQEGEGFLVTGPANVRYLSGFAGEGTLIVTVDRALLITDFRYIIDAAQCSTGFEVKDIAEGIKTIMPESIKRLYVEGSDMTLRRLANYRAQFPSMEFIDCENRIDRLRYIKDEEEIEKISHAAHIADLAFEYLLTEIQIGVSEADLALELEYQMRKRGAQGVSFDTIAASGENSASPHAVPTQRKLQRGDFLTLDFGCVFEGYCSDMTRTVVIGEASERQREIYNLVLEAQLAGLKAAKPGAICSEVDKAARDIIANAGHGSEFGHSLGHSVGLEIHENPSFSPKCDEVLKEGMVITVEPGVYIEGYGGVRIEDLIVIREDGPQILSKTKKDLLIL